MHDLLNTAPCGFVTFADDGTIVEINETLADMLGFNRVEILGWHVDKILPPGGRIFYHTYLFPLLKVQESVDEIYVALRARDGSDIPVLLNGVRRERGGRFVSDCVCLKMIQRHAYEDQLLQARRLAEESATAKAKFLSMMSHDLRTPLTTIYGNAQALAGGLHGPLDPKQLEAVDEIREACRLQMTMVNDILEFARLDSGRVEMSPLPISVEEVVSRAAGLVRIQVTDAGLTLTTHGCDGDTAVLADPKRLQQIMLNLLTNALKFTPAGGEISVRCESEDGRVRITVSDTGIGIPPDYLPRIFSPFVQVEGAAVSSSSSQGVGLGLAISRDLARAMNGDVAVDSRPGEGSSFHIDLPAAQAARVKSRETVSIEQ